VLRKPGNEVQVLASGQNKIKIKIARFNLIRLIEGGGGATSTSNSRRARQFQFKGGPKTKRPALEWHRKKISIILYYGALRRESNRAKPRELGRVFPARHREKSKISPLGQTPHARAAHLLAQSGYFRSAWFSLGNDPRPKISPR
jgi:hypothetical protein